MNANIQLSHSLSITDRLIGLFTKKKSTVQALSSSGLNDITYRLMVKAMTAPANSTALQFQEVFERTGSLEKEEWAFLANEPEGKKVLVDNEYLKVLMIRWAPGDITAIHGHPAGGGLIKVLEGSVEELRYIDGESPVFYAKNEYHRNAVAYIDDSLGQHAVGNPFNGPAVTLHAYLKYRKNNK